MTIARPHGARGPLLVLLLALGCGGGPDEEAATTLSAGTPVVLISIDTLRSDRLPAYGYEGVETPALDALAADAVLFERAYAHVSLTLPSHATVLTGLLPADHGVRDNMGYRLETSAVPYLPRLLGASGYATGAAVSAFVLRGTTGLAEGFDLYEDRIEFVPGKPMGGLQRPGGETLRVALPWLDSVRERPFFLFFHIYEPHSPYDPPEPWRSRYPSPYDGEVAAADAVVGELLDALRERDLYGRSLVVLMSDHGEGLGDHGEQEHEILLHRETLQVPLMIKLPDRARAGTRVATPVQLADLLPTIAGLLDLPVPAEAVGTSLLGPLDAERPIVSENVYGRLHFGWSELVSVVQGRHHLIHGPRPELYDLVEDPQERTNLVDEQRSTAHTLRRALEGVDLTLEPPAAESDPEVRRQLEALGYVATFAPETDGPRPDPKSKLHVVEALGRARRLADTGDYDGAVTAYRELLAGEPDLTDAWEYLAQALLRLDRHDEAIDAYRRALELSSGAPHIALAAAYAYFEVGDFDQARRHAELASSTQDVAPDLLARIALRQDDLETAARRVDEALSRRGSRIGPLVTAAELRLEQERPAETLELTDQARREFEAGTQQDPTVIRGLYLARGKALTLLRRPEEAIAAFEREISTFPDHLDAYTHLAYLHALLGDAPAAGATLRRLVEGNPKPRAYAAAVRALREMNDPRAAAAVLRDARRRWPEDRELRELGG